MPRKVTKKTAPTIFFSWESDLPSATNHYAIKNCIEKAIKGTPLSYDEATRGESGSTNILDAIFKKILVADIFVCDITTVGTIQNTNSANRPLRPTPNPNVLLELGYAIANLGLERVVLIYNKKYAGENIREYSDLPFDIPKQRIIGYTLADKNDKTEKENLTNRLKYEINAILKKDTIKNSDIIRDVREGKRVKDVENLNWFLRRVSLTDFDIFRDNLPMRVYMPIVSFFEIDLEYCHTNSLFHIHNVELRTLIDDFRNSLSRVCRLGGILHYPDRVSTSMSGNPESSYNKGLGFYTIHGSLTDDRDEFDRACSMFEIAYQRLIPYIRDYYTLKEVDVDKLSFEAHRDFIDWHKAPLDKLLNPKTSAKKTVKKSVRKPLTKKVVKKTTVKKTAKSAGRPKGSRK